MRGVILILILALPGCFGDRYYQRTGQEFVERTPDHHVPYVHTPEQSGIDKCPKRSLPSVTDRNILGYVNCSTFGMDYSLFRHWPERLFPGVWPEGRKRTSFTDKYATDPAHPVKDIIAAQPFRRAVKAAKAEKHAHPEE